MGEMGKEATACLRAGRMPTTNPSFHEVAPFERSENYGEMGEWFKPTVY